MRITGAMWFAAAACLATLSIAAQCLLAAYLERRAMARHTYLLAAFAEVRETVLRDSLTGLGDLAATLREGYRTLDRTCGAVLAAGREIVTATSGAAPHD